MAGRFTDLLGVFFGFAIIIDILLFIFEGEFKVKELGKAVFGPFIFYNFGGELRLNAISSRANNHSFFFAIFI